MCNATCAVLDLRSWFHLNPDGERPCNLIRGWSEGLSESFLSFKREGVTQALDLMEKRIIGDGF